MLQFGGARGVEDISRTDESAGKSSLSELFSHRLSLSMTADKNAQIRWGQGRIAVQQVEGMASD